MTIATEELRKLVDEATQDDFPTTRHVGKEKLDRLSIHIATELIAARAKLAAADDLYAALKLILPVAKAHYRFNGIQDSAFVAQADAALAKARGET